MDEKFLIAIETLHEKFELLKAAPRFRFGEVPLTTPKSGVYLFSEADRHLYAGRSNRLRERYFLHCRPGSRPNQASFAFKLARETFDFAGSTKINGPDGRKGLASTAEFMQAFDLAKERIRNMEYRFVEETDQPRQALLEAYCAIALEIPYNDFNTH